MKRILVALVLLVAVNAHGLTVGHDSYKLKINNLLGLPAPGVLVNDNGSSFATLQATTTSGKLTFNSNGSFTYKPNPNFVGRDHFSYVIGTGPVKSTLAHVFIDVYATAKGSVSGPGVLCNGETGDLAVDLLGEPPFKVTWKDGVVQQSSSSRIVRTVQPAVASIFKIEKIEDKNGPGPVSPASLSVAVAARPAAPAILGDPGLEVGEALTLTASTVNSDYQWYFNGTALEDEVGRTLTIDPAQASDSGVYTVTGRNALCHSLQSFPAEVKVAPTRIVPVAGSANGAYGSVFRSTIQIHNRTDSTVNGTFDFYDAVPGAPSKTPFSAPPRGTIAYTDVAALFGANAVGSFDVTAPAGPLVPDAVVRIYNDAGEAGTTGVNVPQVRLRDVLRIGDTAVVIGPAEPNSFRFNVGIRTLESGVSLNVRSYGADGQLRMVVQRYYPPDSFRQLSSTDLLGLAPTPSETLRFEIESGSAVIYGATVENRTNDPVIQLAEKVIPQLRPTAFVVPAAASQVGGFGSWFKTALQIHNPGETAVTVSMGYRPALQIAGTPKFNRIYKILPFATLSIDDLLPALGTSGFGSLDLTATGPTRPVFLARIFNDGIEGETGTAEPVLAVDEVPRAGDRVLLISPATPSSLRFNIGIRTLAEGATIDFTVRNAAGAIRSAGRREYPTSYLVQQAANEMFGLTLGANDSIELRVVHGAAIVYGSSTDNITQDSSLQLSKW